MKLFEIDFDKPWVLKTDTNTTDFVQAQLRKQIPTGLIQVWENEGDPQQIIFTFEYNRFWEVHHLFVDDNRVIHSGTREKTLNSSPSIGFYSTAKELYKRHLDRGRKIKITTTPELWKSYKRVVSKMIADTGEKHRLVSYNDNDIAFDGEPCVSAIIESKGKFLNKTRLS